MPLHELVMSGCKELMIDSREYCSWFLPTLDADENPGGQVIRRLNSYQRVKECHLNQEELVDHNGEKFSGMIEYNIGSPDLIQH